jgi:ParB/RepB/Spo0J family partition protein
MTTLQVFDAPVDSLDVGHDFRIDDDPVALAEMVESIKALGIIQPLLVRAVDDRFEVLAGRRRLAAARHADLTTVPCIERDDDDEHAIHVTLAENLHRRHLSPVEEGLAYAHLRAQGMTQAAIARQVGRSHQLVSFLLRVVDLPGETRDKIHRGELSYMVALYPHAKRTGKRQGGDKPRATGGNESVLITHWRRRHDRMVAGIRAVTAAHPATVQQYRVLLDRLLKLDLKPIDDIAPDRDWRADYGGRHG